MIGRILDNRIVKGVLKWTLLGGKRIRLERPHNALKRRPIWIEIQSRKRLSIEKNWESMRDGLRPIMWCGTTRNCPLGQGCPKATLVCFLQKILRWRVAGQQSEENLDFYSVLSLKNTPAGNWTRTDRVADEYWYRLHYNRIGYGKVNNSPFPLLKMDFRPTGYSRNRGVPKNMNTSNMS